MNTLKTNRRSRRRLHCHSYANFIPFFSSLAVSLYQNHGTVGWLMIAWTSLALKFILVYLSKSGIILHQQEDAIFEEYPKISHVDMRKIFTRELIIYSFWGNSMSSHYDIQPNINIMASSECTQNELEVKIRFHCNISSSLLYLPLTAFLKLASTF